MRIYFAGKITKSGWREEIVPELELMPYEDSRYSWPVLPNTVLNKYDYVGPYFIGDDHGSFHGESAHGVGGTASPNSMGTWVQEWGATPEREVLELCLTAITWIDIVFAWIDSNSAYGTLAELGYAKALKKRIFIGLPKNFQHSRDLWFILAMADDIVEADTASEALATVMKTWEAQNGSLSGDDPIVIKIMADPIAQKWSYKPLNIRQYPGNLEPATPRQIDYLYRLARKVPQTAEDMLHIVKLEFGDNATYDDCNKAVASFAIAALRGDIKPNS